VGGLEVTVSLGTYPVLVIASAPQPIVTLAGIAIFLAGCAWMLAAPRRSAAAKAVPA